MPKIRSWNARSWSEAVVLALWLACIGFVSAAPPKSGPPAIVAVETRDLRVEFAGDRAWTIYRILHQGVVVADKVGFYGTVLSPEGGNWIGTGHTEGGVEQVALISLTVDGEDRPLTHRAVYQARRAAIRKHSMLGPVRLEATYVVTDDMLLERHRYEVTSAVNVNRFYAFMHPWVPGTSEWIAESTTGQISSGDFVSDGSFKPREDVKWIALYHPGTQRAMLTWFPSPPIGQGLKTAFWDHQIYHKLYTQLYEHAELTRGTVFEYSLVIRGLTATPGSWQEGIKALALETKRSFPHRAGTLD